MESIPIYYNSTIALTLGPLGSPFILVLTVSIWFAFRLWFVVNSEERDATAFLDWTAFEDGEAVRDWTSTL